MSKSEFESYLFHSSHELFIIAKIYVIDITSHMICHGLVEIQLLRCYMLYQGYVTIHL